jgi:hypothetical protein
MRKQKNTSDIAKLNASELVQKLGDETQCFTFVEAHQEWTDKHHKIVWDEVITLSVKPNQQRVMLFIEVRQQLSPKTLLGVFQRLKSIPVDGVQLICSRHISPRVAEMCREQNVGYLDGVGNCWIAAPGLFVHIMGRPNQPAVSKAVDPFSKKSSRIVRTLLAHPNKGWQVQKLAMQAGVSLGLVSKVKTTLLEEAYLEERDRLLFVRDADKLLRGWSDDYLPQVRPLQLFAIPRPLETEKRLADWCRANKISYALTQLAGAWRYSPMVRYDKSVVYLDRKLETGRKLKDLLEVIDAREVDSGANCTLWLTDDPAVFTDAKEFDGINVVSPLQLYLDLKVLSGRGEEAAQEIFTSVLRPMFASREATRGGDR